MPNSDFIAGLQTALDEIERMRLTVPELLDKDRKHEGAVITGMGVARAQIAAKIGEILGHAKAKARHD